MLDYAVSVILCQFHFVEGCTGVVVFVVQRIIQIYPCQRPLKVGQDHVFVCFIWCIPVVLAPNCTVVKTEGEVTPGVLPLAGIGLQMEVVQGHLCRTNLLIPW